MRTTSGPAQDEDKSINVGVAAHITAASPGGPRYDASLEPETRRSAPNGIWLCQVCAKLIDSDLPRFPADQLRKWKQDAVERAFTAIATARPGARAVGLTPFQLDDADWDFLRALALPEGDDVESVTKRLLEAAAHDIAAFRRAKEWPSHTLSLRLTLQATDGWHNVTLDGVANGIGVPEGVSIVAPPGTGKTTTLVQLADTILSAGHKVPAIVPLGEWSDRLNDFFSFLGRRNAFRPFRPQYLMQLAYHGRLVLLLDGWNELDPASRVRATRDLKALRRDYPLLGIVIGTRQQMLPISGPIVEIQALSEDQQLELALALKGKVGEALVDQAWRTAGLRELIAIPLYLNALLARTPEAAFPQTKEEVLRLFVTQHEQAPEKAEILHKELFGFHTDMLIGLGVEANRAANTMISDSNARRAIYDVEARLTAQGQLTVLPQPTRVLDVLVDSHALVRSSAGDGGVSFQHQQFQEWYASLDVECQMREAAQGNAKVRKRLGTVVLNWPRWEESILFACERLSRNGAAGAQAVAAAVLDALAIDPMLAAEMIYRAAPEVWEQVKQKTIAFAASWHEQGKVERGARFMVTTGRPEFAPYIWPLISSKDTQVYLRVLRTARRLRPSVLGPDAKKRLSELPEDSRQYVLAEIGHRGGFDAMELAADLAKTDPSPHVVVEIVQSLQFRRADRHVSEILRVASDEVWTLVATKGYPNELADASLNARLAELRRARIANETDPIRAIEFFAQWNGGEPSAGERIKQLIQSVDFPVENQHAGAAVHHAFDAFPQQTASALMSRIAAGLELPRGAEEFLKDAPPLDDGPVAAAALNKATPERIARTAFKVIGPKTVGVMMEQLFALDTEFEQKGQAVGEAERTEYLRLMNGILASRDPCFFVALLQRAGSDNPRRIQLMADLLSRHAKGDDSDLLMVGENVRNRLGEVLDEWIGKLLASPHANRHQFSHVACAAGRLREPKLVSGLQQMLERDLADWARARQEYARSGRRAVLTPDVTHSWTLQYRTAFGAIGGAQVIALMRSYLPDLRFGLDAACALMEIWNREHPTDKDRHFAPWHNFSEVRARRKQRENTQHPMPTCDSAEVIFEVTRELGTRDKDDATQRHAIGLAKIGLHLPHGTKRDEVETLLNLPQPYAIKQGLLTAAAMVGEIISAETLLAGTRELLGIAKKESWRLDENHGELMGWIELFAFSDQPGVVLNAIDLLPAAHRHAWRLHRLLSALGESPHLDVLPVLVTLAKRDAELLKDYHWLNAMIALATEESARALLELICDGNLTANYRGLDGRQLSQHLARLGEKFPLIQDEMLRRYAGISNGQPKAILESALIEIADEPIILALIQAYAIDGRPFGGGLFKALRHLAIGQRPAAAWPGAYEEFGVPLTALRKKFFGMLKESGAQSSLAEACLIAVDELRDEHGRIDDEPRHPDIESGRAWPKEAKAIG
jgi:hypothetical protein